MSFCRTASCAFIFVSTECLSLGCEYCEEKCWKPPVSCLSAPASAVGRQRGKISMQPEKVSLTGVSQTLLITAHAKAMESRMPGSLLKDRFADDALGRLDYDVGKVDLGPDGAVSMAMRAKILDDWTRSFIDRHEDAVVLNLGCGLDSRVFRVDPPEGVTWYDVDLPDVVALRQRIYPERNGGYRLIATSVTDLGWLEDADARRPAMVVAEGLMPYLPSAEAPKLVERLVDHFTTGELAFDGYSSLGLKVLRMTPQVRATGAEV